MKNTENRKEKVNLLMNKAFIQVETFGRTLKKFVEEELAEIKKKQNAKCELSESESQFVVDLLGYLSKRAKYSAALKELHDFVKKDPEIVEGSTQKAIDEFEKALNDLLTVQEKLEEHLRRRRV